MGHRGGHRPALPGRAQPARPRARELRPRPGVGAGSAGQGGRSAPASDRRGRRFPGRGGSGCHAGRDVPRRRQRRRLDRRCPGRAVRGGEHRARSADRNGRRSRRGALGAVLRRGHAQPGRAGGWTADRDRQPAGVPARLHVRAGQRRHRAAAGHHRRLSAAGRRSSARGSRPGVRRTAELRRRRWRSARRLRMEDHRRSVRRTHHHVPGRGRRAQGGLHRAQRHAGRRRASRRAGRHAGQDAASGAGAESRRSRRRRQAQGNAHERHAGREGQPRAVRPDCVRRAGPLLCHRAEEPRRRGEDQRRAAAPARGRSHDPVHAGPADPAAPALARARCTSRSPSPS